MLSEVASIAFGSAIRLVPGKDAILFARDSGSPVVAVFGKRWGGELRLPQRSGSGGYFVDWVLAKIDAFGKLEEFVAVEVQTIDSTGSYRKGVDALEDGRVVVDTRAGLNWENVSKRILPQLIYKGQVLQRESLCKSGLFFVCPDPVYRKIVARLGGQDALLEYPIQPASITFLSYNFTSEEVAEDGKMLPIRSVGIRSTTVYKVQEAFNNVALPAANVYRDGILRALKS